MREAAKKSGLSMVKNHTNNSYDRRKQKYQNFRRGDPKISKVLRER
ncbi:3987_t:CDS:2 [Rhizophagus irregularis]|nr:3987_t:CDS:2 [Rhizophagus irregularis]